MLYYVYYLFGWQWEISTDILCINSYSPTTRQMNYVVQVFPHDDCEPSLKLYDRIIYNH